MVSISYTLRPFSNTNRITGKLLDILRKKKRKVFIRSHTVLSQVSPDIEENYEKKVRYDEIKFSLNIRN